MVPPGDIGSLPIWVGVYLALVLVSAVSGYVFYNRVLRLIRQGKEVASLTARLCGSMGPWSLSWARAGCFRGCGPGTGRDWATHNILGVPLLLLSYVIFIFGGSIWRAFPEKLLTGTGVRVYSSYLEIAAAVLLLMLAWALVRRWVVRPRRLSFDLTRNLDSVIVVGLIAGLMLSTILTHSFYVAQGGHGPESEVLIGGALGDWFTDLGIGTGAANTLQGIFWWTHLGIILGFAIYIPFSKHMHMVASPMNAFFRSLEPRGALAPIDLENTEKFGAGPGAGLHVETAFGRLRLRRVRPLLRCLPGQPYRESPVADAHCGEPERSHGGHRSPGGAKPGARGAGAHPG